MLYNRAMKKVFIIHGYGGMPNKGWRPWLMRELAKINIWACALQMPMVDNPKKNDWVEKIKYEIALGGGPENDIYLVGHSLGVCAILHYLQGNNICKIKGAVLVSGPIYILSKEKYRPIDNFMDSDFDYKKIKENCEKFVVIHGDNDQAVPYSHGIELANNLSCELMTVKKGDHLSYGNKLNKLPQVLNAIKKML